VAVNAHNPDSGKTEAAIILVSGATQVTITNVVVDGSVASASINNGCSPPSYDGVLFLGASGALTNSIITNFYQASPSLYGCQDNAADGVLVQTAAGGASIVSITNNVVTNFQKNGVACKGAGSNCSVVGNTVSPLAAASSATGDATNGIEVAYGAVATVSGNTISGNECNVSVCGSDLTTQTQATGVLTYQSGASTVVQGNTISGNDIGVATVGDVVAINNNVLSSNRYEGMLLNDGAYTASGNTISGSLIGIAVVSDGFVANPTTATLTGNNFVGSFSTSLVQLVAFYGGAYGGPNAESASVSVEGVQQTATPGSAGVPSTVNITPPAPSTTTSTTTTSTATSTATTTNTATSPPQCATGLYSGYYTNSTTDAVVNFANVSYTTAWALVTQNAPGGMLCESASAVTSPPGTPVLSPGGASLLTVNTEALGGNAITGYYSVLYQNGQPVATGFSPYAFSVSSGQAYAAEVQDYGSCHFDHWTDTGSTDRQRTFVAASSAQTLTAMYDCGAAATAFSGINVSTMNSAGGSIVGYYTTLWQNGVQLQACFSPCSFTVNNGQTYQVAVADYGNGMFNHWSDGTHARFYTVVVPGSSAAISLIAVYSP
jgi:hypothetical protein